jgi:CRISPR system Cascade subunit CasB
MSEIVNNPFPAADPQHRSFAVLDAWWRALDDDRGGRAALRCAATPIEVMLVPAYHRLLHALREAGQRLPESRLTKLAAIAGIAACVREAGSGSLGGDFGGAKSDKAALTALRLRRLLACDDAQELYPQLRRAIALLGQRANVSEVASTVWYWSPLSENRPNDPRRRLAYDYYAVAPNK